jgi:streptogramin lyase
MTPSNMNPGTATQALRRALLQAASDLLTARARRRPTDRVRTRLEGLEDRCLLTPVITEFTLPSADSGTSFITAGPDGNIWFTEGYANKIGRINPADNTFREFVIPSATITPPNGIVTSSPRGITMGPDGNLWFVEFATNKIGKVDLANNYTITEYTVPTSGAQPQGITTGPDGNLWFTEWGGNKIGMFNPSDPNHIYEFPVLTASAHPHAITAGPDGNVWFTEPNANQIGKVDLTHHYAINEFTGISSINLDAITAGPDGNLWFTESGGATGYVGMINPATGVIADFPVPGGLFPKSIVRGQDGNLWFTAYYYTGYIGMYNPTIHAFTQYSIPYAGSSPWGITSAPDGSLWFADRGTNAIGVVSFYTNNLAVTAQPPPSVTAGSGFGLTVQAQDSSGNPITSFNGTVTLALASNPGGATLGGTLTATASAGLATFSGLTLNKAASGYTLVASASGLGPGLTSAMTVTPASPTQLVITQQPPATVEVNKAFAMKASVEDAYGNVVTTASGSVSVAFANNPTGATLGGTKSVTVSQGVASFTNLTINKNGSGYTLKVTSGGLTSATSNPINVTQNGKAPSPLSASTSAGTGAMASDLSLAPLVLDSPDLWDGLRFKKRSRTS